MTHELRQEIEQLADERQKEIPIIAQKRAEEEKILFQEPSWTEPIFTEEFDKLPDCKSFVSPLNNQPFSVQNSILSISALPHTYAYFSCPLNKIISGFLVRFKQGTDGGMSWGPGVQIRWKNGTRLRVGIRSDGLIQLDIGGEQKLFKEFTLNEWVQLRVRWTAHYGIIEKMKSNNQWQRITQFTHTYPIDTPAENISFGKIPYNGEPIDYQENQNLPIGTNEWDRIIVF